ncbi:MAG: efflux transporter periplasmic adaptor subunit [Rubrivivax sp.]|nr:efflux transporter periplasmic adaptor subunit [Rubrivivax sp.]
MNVSRRSWWLLALGTAGAVALLAWAFAPRPIEVETAPATRGRFELSIEEDARTRIAERYVISAPLAGRLERPALREGDAVRQGEVVARLTPVMAPLLDARTQAELRARLDAAGTNVHRAATRVQAARIAQDRAALELQRSEQLAAQGFLATTRLESDRLALQAAREDLSAAVDSQRIAAAERAQAEVALSALQATPGRAFALLSPVSGQVLKVHQASETTAALGMPLLEVGDTRRLEIVADVLTPDALQATPGREVRIERWGGPVALQGRVRRVEPAAFTKISALGVEEQRVRVLIDVTSPAEQWAALGDGFRVTVQIVTRAADQVLLVPVSAVFPAPGGAQGQPAGSAVFVLREGQARLTPVRVAARNASVAWVESGLDAGATVIVYPPPSVNDGARVRVRRS